jgi:hypothetical protein
VGDLEVLRRWSPKAIQYVFGVRRKEIVGIGIVCGNEQKKDCNVLTRFIDHATARLVVILLSF